MSGNNDQNQRWKGRHNGKDNLRKRIWGGLESTGAAIGSPWSAIPNFVGAELAAEQLLNLSKWKSANVVKCNPDKAQAWVRLNALKQGKRLYTPVPELTNDFPFILLDPEALRARGIAFEYVMYSEGFLEHGQPVEFREIEPLDFIVVGCVAVTAAGGRTGKGAGFADLEMGIFQSYGIMEADTPVATTVHSIQLVDDGQVCMEAHDVPLDYIATPEKLVKTHTEYARPNAIDWDAIQPDQYQNIPFLTSVREQLKHG